MPTAAAMTAPLPAADPMHKDMANAIRALAMDAVQQANSGHPGMPMGMADVATVLWSQFLRFDSENPTWPNRESAQAPSQSPVVVASVSTDPERACG